MNITAENLRHWANCASLTRDQVSCLSVPQLNALADILDSLQATNVKLAAENAALKSCAEFYSSGFSPVKGTFGLEWGPTGKLLDDCGNVASDALKTPATDAYATTLHAEGVEMAFKAAKLEVASEFQRETFDQCVTAAVKYPQSDLAGKVEMVAWLELFAAQLRSKSSPKHADPEAASQIENRERDLFEEWVMTQRCISKSTLEGLRTESGYRNSTLSGNDYNKMWLDWNSNSQLRSKSEVQP